ncbi:hypothetical protein JAAARDRAFT_200602 [Jaapia argillacea MUCL 33604]|uniref:Uncharacterized protein n=1 Tax=Jaapia argillacea MUCL 33604 TaxID=933084 RepID=A0A067PH25_9AGAM|nr:hypothetical protein JAAARDRAFT_200602 [Jaapia argillacea MUCL 33604]
MALIAPELLVVWSMKQWLVARRLAKKHQDRNWTKTHGFFALMGGFMLVDGEGEPVQLLHPDNLSMVDVLDREFPRITEGEILDKSKRDALSKGLIMVQTTWFILQCAARWYEHLPITELEIATLAFTVLNLITYAFWWNKPADVRRPHQVVKCSVVDTTNNDFDSGEGEAEVRNKPRGDPGNQGGFFVGLWDALEDYHPAFRPIIFLILIVSHMLVDGLFMPCFMPKIGSSIEIQVPTCYSGCVSDMEDNLIASVSVCVATLFGAIHCFAWSLQFPSSPQQLLWRVSALTITSVPIIEFLGYYVGFMLDKGISRALGVLMLFTATAYIAARVTLLVLAFTSLRSLPPGAYEAVYWTTFIPHV